MALDIIASFLIAVLAGMGVGGGGLLVIYLSLIKNVDQFTSQGINLLFFICAAAAAMIFNFKKRQWNIGYTAVITVSGAAFAVLGSLLAASADTGVLRTVFGALLILSGLIVFFSKSHK